jgi:hypothetical protein
MTRRNLKNVLLDERLKEWKVTQASTERACDCSSEETTTWKCCIRALISERSLNPLSKQIAVVILHSRRLFKFSNFAIYWTADFSGVKVNWINYTQRIVSCKQTFFWIFSLSPRFILVYLPVLCTERMSKDTNCTKQTRFFVNRVYYPIFNVNKNENQCYYENLKIENFL